MSTHDAREERELTEENTLQTLQKLSTEALVEAEREDIAKYLNLQAKYCARESMPEAAQVLRDCAREIRDGAHREQEE